MNKISPALTCSDSVKYDNEIRFESTQNDYRGENGTSGFDDALYTQQTANKREIDPVIVFDSSIVPEPFMDTKLLDTIRKTQR